MTHQQDLFTDLPRGEQLAALRRLKLSTHECLSGRVSGAVQKAVLKAIDDHEGSRASFASQKTIAAETGYGVSTVRRAIAALVDRDLITRDRPSHWSPNHHRINWTELSRLASECGELSTATSERPRVHRSTSEGSVVHLPEFTEAPPRVHHEPRNAHLIAQESPTTNRPDEWAEVVAELFRWGLKSAPSAVDSARERGMSIEHVRELWLECGGHREPQRWEPGQLANWLTGKTPPPFDHDEAARRIAERERALDWQHQNNVDSIRFSVQASGQIQKADAWVTAGITFRKLRDAGLARFATAEESSANDRMDEFDRQRSEKNGHPESQGSGVHSRSARVYSATSQAGNVANALGYNFKPRSVPGIGLKQRQLRNDRLRR